MTAAVFNLSQSLSHACDCIKCGVPIVMPSTRENWLRNGGRGETFYCLNGHAQVFSGQTEAERIQKLLDTERAWREREQKESARQRELREAAERQVSAARGQVTKLKNRASAGLCGCCNRHFTNLERHMATKHPEEGVGRDV